MSEITCENCGHTMEVKVPKSNGNNRKWETKTMTFEEELPFGKHKGRVLRDIVDEDYDYYEWLIENKVISVAE